VKTASQSQAFYNTAETELADYTGLSVLSVRTVIAYTATFLPTVSVYSVRSSSWGRRRKKKRDILERESFGALPALQLQLHFVEVKMASNIRTSGRERKANVRLQDYQLEPQSKKGSKKVLKESILPVSRRSTPPPVAPLTTAEEPAPSPASAASSTAPPPATSSTEGSSATPPEVKKVTKPDTEEGQIKLIKQLYTDPTNFIGYVDVFRAEEVGLNCIIS
jgi:hypothetical protein